MPAETMSVDDVPIELRMLAVAAINANDALPENDRDQTPDHMLAAVLPTHERMVREQVAKEIRDYAGQRPDDIWQPSFWQGLQAGARIARGES